MKGGKKGKKEAHLIRNLALIMSLLIFAVLLAIIYFPKGPEDNLTRLPPQEIHSEENSSEKTDDQVLVQEEGVEIVEANCTSCHSARLIVQNRATREGWLNMIRWMQQTQNLWDLGENEEVILDYLSKHYPPEEKGRRENLKNIDWYELK